ncbi:nitroreductase family protein, partial [Helicobacter pylori]
MKFLDQEKRRQLLNERHSCKMFDSHYAFSSEELEEIAEIARLSPSSYNTQPWHFVMVTDKDVKSQIAAHSYFNKDMIESASALMVVCSL